MAVRIQRHPPTNPRTYPKTNGERPLTRKRFLLWRGKADVRFVPIADVSWLLSHVRFVFQIEDYGRTQAVAQTQRPLQCLFERTQ